ncbi:MAG: NUDIX domain-containing protein [bacterium]
MSIKKILVIKSKDKISNNWDLPGGLMEPGETARDALIREVEEETGIICEPTEFIGVYTNRPYIEYKNGDKAHVVSIFFLCRAIGGNLEPDGDESLETLFVDFARGYELLIRHKETLDDFKNNLRGVISKKIFQSFFLFHQPLKPISFFKFPPSFLLSIS